MKLKITLTNNSSYSEEGQKNPIRFKTLFKNEDGSFVDQSGWIKCKDFYNDTVAFFREGSVFSIYSYDNKVKANKEGVYFLLKGLHDKNNFLTNLAVVNKQLFSDLKCEVGYLQHDEADKLVIMIPPALWETTYRISMITMCIRICNYDVTYTKWDDLWAPKAPINSIEHSFTADAKANAKNLGFKVPEKFQKYWWYCGPNHNSEKNPKQTGGTIHNNGVSSWSQWMKQA